MKKVTLTIGIPAYNEEKNIAQLIHSIILQRQGNYKLEKLYVVCDGCKDNTAQIVSNLSQKYPFIKLYGEKRKRIGKAGALNRIYELNKSDFLLTFDADLILENNDAIELMIKEITKGDKINVVGPRYIPVSPNTLMGKFAYVSYLSFED